MNQTKIFDGGRVTSASFAAPAAPMRMTDEAIASGGAFLIAELEKRDPLVRKPLTSFTYARDIPMKVGGGWTETASALNIGYGLTGGNMAHAAGANGIPIIEANLEKDTFKSHIFAVAMRIMFVDMQRAGMMGRSLDQLLSDGVRMAYDKHMDANAYVGLAEYGTTGLLNNAKVTTSNVRTTDGKTAWKDKTAQQILDDINDALSATWAAAEHDLAAIPNHILLPYEQYLYLLNTKASDLAEQTLLDFILKNNIAAKNGADLFIGATHWCKGTGTGGTDRMAVYVNHERYLAVEELAPLSRVMTQPNAAGVCYDSAYMANISETELYYTQTIQYFDGI